MLGVFLQLVALAGAISISILEVSIYYKKLPDF